MNTFFICSFVSIAFFIFISYDYFLQPIVPVTQPSGRGGRRNFASSNSYQGSGRNASFKRENGANHVTRGSRTAQPATNKASNITVPNETKVSGPASIPSEVSNHKAQDDPSLISASRCSSKSDQGIFTFFHEFLVCLKFFIEVVFSFDSASVFFW
jgi:uridine kinase